MPRKNYDSSAAVRISYTPVADHRLLDALIRAHRDQLVQTARHHLGGCFRADADDIVQDVCLAVLEGDVDVSSDPVDALDDLLAAVIAAAEAHASGEA